MEANKSPAYEGNVQIHLNVHLIRGPFCLFIVTPPLVSIKRRRPVVASTEGAWRCLGKAVRMVQKKT